MEQLVLTKLPAITFPLVVKSHDVGPAAIAALRAGHARAVCTVRDPRDSVASDMKFMSHPFETAVKRIIASLESLHLLQSIPHVLLVSYEMMMTDRCRQIRRIADHLGVKLDESTVRQIDAKTNLQNSQRVCESLKTVPPGMCINPPCPTTGSIQPLICTPITSTAVPSVAGKMNYLSTEQSN